MKISNIEKRVADLEKHEKEPRSVELIWYDDPRYESPPEAGKKRIQLRWYDEERS
jgi:hypothetical protein